MGQEKLEIPDKITKLTHMVLPIYRFCLRLFRPALEAYLQRRLARGKEDGARLGERMGQPSRPRPEGALIWLHAASVGESISLLSVIDYLGRDRPDLHLLLTTGTVTSAKLMESRLPKAVIHQYVPVDHPDWAESFVNYWRPDLVLWSESELWPNLLYAVKQRRIPAVLLNARMSQKSFSNWRRVSSLARKMLDTFVCCLAQNEAEAARLRVLGAKDVRISANLKYAAPVLPDNEAARMEMAPALGARACVLWASTHPGEEDIAAAVQRDLSATEKNVLTIIVPRHPVRGADIAEQLTAQRFNVVRRSEGRLPDARTEIYLADTLGELGVFFRLCPLVVMGGTFAPIGGHNPIEPAQFGAAIFCGPSMHNFISIEQEFISRGALLRVSDAEDLQKKLLQCLQDPAVAQAAGRAAQNWVNQQGEVIGEIYTALSPWLPAKKQISGQVAA